MEKIFLGEAHFFWGAQTPDDLPTPTLPEVAFAGRSNVGKSSLINALLGRKSLVRTSSTPGQTRALNFFNIGETITFVDMPGYGFAKASKSDIKIFQNLLKSYLRGRVPLRLTCLLIDSRHGFKDSDLEMLKLLNESAVPTRIVLTKADTISKASMDTLIETIAQTVKKHPAAHPVPLLTSSHDSLGIPELRAAILETLGFNAPK
jgi:GTP-binding protein